MTQESARKFIETAQKDPNFKKQWAQLKDQNEMNTFLKKNGYNFTKEEYKAAAKTVLGKELTDQELNKIAGGKGPFVFEQN